MQVPAFLSFLYVKYCNSLLWQFGILLSLGWIFTPVLHFVEKYLWNDWEFIGWLAIVIFADTVTGFIKAWKMQNISSKAWLKFIQKLVVYMLCLISIHAVSAYLSRSSSLNHLSWLADIVLHFDFVIYGAILFRELLSINENLGALGIKLLPNFIIKRFNDFDENGDFKAIKPPETV